MPGRTRIRRKRRVVPGEYIDYDNIQRQGAPNSTEWN